MENWDVYIWDRVKNDDSNSFNETLQFSTCKENKYIQRKLCTWKIWIKILVAAAT